ncbi:MAG: hypothetical protein KDA57_12860 [Planctomycetales bacterium]|nr:hypothetical protein [Planctomycetales bacterium]
MQPGEVYFSVLELRGEEFLRHDYCVEAWQGPPEDCLGWWRSQLPTNEGAAPKLAPTEVMLNLFAALEDRPEDQEFRYLLGLLLLRRRVLRRDDTMRGKADREVLVLHCPRRDEQYELVVVEPTAEQAKQLQQRMVDLLYGNGSSE